MKKLALVLSLVLVIGMFAGCLKKDEDKVVFDGGDIQVTLSEVNYFFFNLKSYYESQAGTEIWAMPMNEEQTFGEAMKENLKELATRSDLMEDMAISRGLSITDDRMISIKAEAASAIEQYSQAEVNPLDEYGITEQVLIDMLMKSDYSNLLFEDVTKDVVIDEALVESTVAEALAADATYQAIMAVGADTYNQEIRARHILVSFLDDTGVKLEGDELAAKLALAEELHQRAIDGEDFAALATEYTDDPGSQETGGEYTFGRDQMVPEFEAAAFGLEVGGISEIVETSYGYHIIKLEEKIAVTDEQVAEAEAVLESSVTEATAEAEYNQRLEVFENVIEDEYSKISFTIDEELWNNINFGSVATEETTEEMTEIPEETTVAE